MNRFSLTFALVLAATYAQAAPAPGDDLKPTVPATSTERTENNPAKAAIEAKEALKKDKAATSERPPAENVAPESDPVRIVEEALRADMRTARLSIQVHTDSAGLIELSGTVPSLQSRTAAESVASKAVAPHPIQNRLVVSEK
ncbi:MAG: BON domain-containing protein [Pseudomonadota bacterium]